MENGKIGNDQGFLPKNMRFNATHFGDNAHGGFDKNEIYKKSGPHS